MRRLLDDVVSLRGWGNTLVIVKIIGGKHLIQELRSLAWVEVGVQRSTAGGLSITYMFRKTQIALAYAYWIKDTCPDISVFWIHASNAQRFRQSFLSIAQECQIPGYSDDSKTDALQLVKNWLEGKGQRPWLMVIDNADDTELFFGCVSQEEEGSHQHTQNENVGQYIPECLHGSILVTTRNKETGIRLTQTRPGGVIDVGRMDAEEAAELFRMRLKDSELATNEVSALSSRLEYLPLALVQAAAFIQENSITVKRYLQHLATTDTTLLSLLSAPFETDGRDSETQHPVAVTWMISFDQIRRQNTVASDLFSLMSYFDRQDIPRLFLSHYNEQREYNHVGYKKRREGEAARALQLEKALGVLKAFSFVTESRDEKLNVHRLVQLVMRNWLAREKRSREFAEKALVTVSNVYPHGNYENRKTCGEYLPHAYAVLSHEGTSSKKESFAKSSLLHSMAEFLLYRGQLNQAEDLQEQAIKIRRRLLGAEHADTLSSIASLAQTYRNQGRLKEAESLGVQAMETRKRVLGMEHPDTLESMANLAWTYRIRGQWKEAENLGVQAMERRKRVLGAEHPDTLTSMANLAWTYRIQGRWKEAEKLGVQAMETRKRVLGTEHPDTLTSMVNVASIYMYQGRWKEAEELELQAVETRKWVLGAEHPDTLKNMADLAWTYLNQGREKEAEELGAHAMEKLKTLLGIEHPDTLTCMANLAWTYRNQGQLQEAEKLQLEVLQTRKRLLGVEHPDTLKSMASLASIYKNRGRWKDAEDLEVQAMETRKRLLGIEHPDTLISMANLARTYKNQDRLQEAEKLEIQAMDTGKKVLGIEHPMTIRSIERLASTYKKQGRWEEAEELEVQAMETRKRVLGVGHPDTLASMANLARTYKYQDRLQEAEKLEIQAMETRKKMLGAEHPDTLTNMHDLALTWKLQGRDNEAVALMAQCVQLRKRVLGQDHPSTTSSLSTLNKWQLQLTDNANSG